MCVRCLCHTHLPQVLSHDLNEVRHGEVYEAVSPGHLQNNIRSQKIVTGEETSGETLSLPLLNKPEQELLSQSAVLRRSSVPHGILTQTHNNNMCNEISTGVVSELRHGLCRYLIEFVFLAELNALSPALVCPVEISSDASELQQIM